MATRKDVARRAGVSTAVVSYVLNGKGRVKDETRERVWEAIRELNYRPDPAARSLKTRKTDQLAVLVNDLTNPFEAELLWHAEHFARASGYSVFFQTFAKEDEQRLPAGLKGRADGVLLLGQSLDNAVFDELREAEIPMLSITRPVWERRELPVIDMNWVAEMRKILRYLRDLGHHAVGFMTNGDPAHPHNGRFQGFVQAAQYESVPVPPKHVLHGGGTFGGGFEALSEYLAGQDGAFTALICANDLMAAGAVAACREAGVPVPGRLAVIGCENILLSSLITPALTTLHYPKEQLAELAVNNLLGAIRGGNPAGFTFESELVVRASTVKFQN